MILQELNRIATKKHSNNLKYKFYLKIDKKFSDLFNNGLIQLILNDYKTESGVKNLQSYYKKTSTATYGQ